jgi:Flp pilus assembly protein TadD
MDLAYLYAVRGLSRKAERCTRIALNLAPRNRFILRSSARFFVHVGRADIAHDLIRRSPGYKEDPWLLAAEVSVALAAKRTPWSTRESFSILNAAKFGPHHVSELSSALGTLEFNSGNASKAKKLLRRSLQKPNDNSLAQAKWIWRQVWGMPADFNVDEFKIDRPFEAAAFEALGQSDWNRAFSSARLWLVDEPFSSDPARLGSYVAATVFEDFARAEALAAFGLIANPDDAGLHIDLAFSYASTGRREEAYKELSKIGTSESEDWLGAAIEANYGLLAFRGGYVEAGRKHYEAAVREADLIADKRTKLTALVYWATEELALPDSNSVRLLAEALETNKAALAISTSFCCSGSPKESPRGLAE